MSGPSRTSLRCPPPTSRSGPCAGSGPILAPALIFLGIRELGLLVLTWMAARNSNSVSEALRSWDGQWFLAIADGGYAGVPAGLVDAFGQRSAETPLAFFPGYPTVVRWFASIDGGGGIGLVTSAFTVTIVSGVVCAYALARIGRHIRGGSPRTGLILVALFAASPMSIVLSMAYSEAMFCALAAWTLVGVLEKRWVLAGVCCTAAGLVRSTGAALVLALGLAVIVAISKRRDGLWPWLGGMIAPLGLLGYLVWVGTRTGEWDGWFALQQRGWGTGLRRRRRDRAVQPRRAGRRQVGARGRDGGVDRRRRGAAGDRDRAEGRVAAARVLGGRAGDGPRRRTD